MPREFWNSIALVAGIVLLATAGPWLARELRTLPSHRALAARADQRIVTLEIGGMTCSGCAAKVKGELSAVPGVSASEVRLDARRAYVVCEKSVSDSVLTAAVQRAGPGFMGWVRAD